VIEFYSDPKKDQFGNDGNHYRGAGIDLIGMTCLFKSTNSNNMPKEEIGLKCYFQ
jgi:hypothetical protein